MARPSKKDNPQFQAEVSRMHAQGMSRAAIGKALGASAATVGLCAEILGLQWDRSGTAAAVQAKQMDNRARRANLVERLHKFAEGQLDRLEADKYRHRVSAGNQSFVAEDDQPNSDEVRNHTQAIYSALAIAQKLEAVDTTPGTDDAISTLRSIGKALGLSQEG